MAGKQEIITTFKSTGLIPVFYHDDANTARRLVDISYEAGIKVFEFTNRGPNAYAVFKELLKHVAGYRDFTLGIGTIMDAPTTEKFIDAGAHFVVSPMLSESMSSVCARHDILWIPGCATVTEIANARSLGATLIKIFPANVLTPAFVSAVLPLMPDLSIMPTGGVEPTRTNLHEWFSAGVTCVGMGSQLFNKKTIESGEWNTLKSEITKAMNTIAEVRASLKK